MTRGATGQPKDEEEREPAGENASATLQTTCTTTTATTTSTHRKGEKGGKLRGAGGVQPDDAIDERTYVANPSKAAVMVTKTFPRTRIPRGARNGYRSPGSFDPSPPIIRKEILTELESKTASTHRCLPGNSNAQLDTVKRTRKHH